MNYFSSLRRMRLIVSGVTPKNEAMFFKGTASFKSGQRFIHFLYRISGLQYKSRNLSYTISYRFSATYLPNL